MTLPKHLQPRKLPKQGRSRALVDAIVEATARVLLDKGYEGTSVAEVAEVAGVGIGSLYQYFPNKEALVVALIERQADAEAKFLEERFAALAPTGLESLIAEAVRAVLAFRALHPQLQPLLVEVIPIVGRYYDLRQRGVRTTERLRLLLSAFYVPADGRPSLDELVFVVANATHALTHEGLLPRPASLDDERLANEIARLLVGYLEA
jgi:AcrR family transcriptional regulator